MLVDTHCHLTYDELAGQLPAVLGRAAGSGVTRLITVATQPDDARTALAVVRHHPQVHLAAGVHPHEAAKVGDAELSALADLHRGRWAAAAGLADRLVAVGETGLDFHYDFAPPQRQEEVFRRQLELACEVGRPVIIHARKSEARVCEVLSEYPALRDRAVFHCFSGGPELAARVLEMGFWLSFTGVVTFKKSAEIQAAARAAPAERIMVETDAPYLTPEPVRKLRPNEPAFVAHTARFLAELRGEAFDVFARRTTANAVRFFGLPEERE
ncbi:MAG: TatD family hydrolase [Phycisphaerae bacterium]|jgi:TatD DNase family protein